MSGSRFEPFTLRKNCHYTSLVSWRDSCDSSYCSESVPESTNGIPLNVAGIIDSFCRPAVSIVSACLFVLAFSVANFLSVEYHSARRLELSGAK